MLLSYPHPVSCGSGSDRLSYRRRPPPPRPPPPRAPPMLAEPRLLAARALDPLYPPLDPNALGLPPPLREGLLAVPLDPPAGRVPLVPAGRLAEALPCRAD